MQSVPGLSVSIVASFLRFVTRSLKDAWFLDLGKLKEIDFPANSFITPMHR